MDSPEHENRPSVGHENSPSQEQHTVEILVQSLFQDRTASWVRIVRGVDKYVTESMLTKKEETGEKSIAKARPRQKKQTVTLTPVFYSCS